MHNNEKLRLYVALCMCSQSTILLRLSSTYTYLIYEPAVSQQIVYAHSEAVTELQQTVQYTVIGAYVVSKTMWMKY